LSGAAEPDPSTTVIPARFAANLVRCRRAAGISQEELGFQASLHRTEVGMLERGHRIPRIDTLVKLAGALEVRPEDLLEGVGWSPGGFREGEFREEIS